MKVLLAAIAIAIAPGLALAQTAPAKKHVPAGTNKKLAPSAQKAVEEATPIDTDPDVKLGDAEIEVARKVFVGDMPCELGASVKVTPLKRDGFFMVTTKGYRFAMHPVESRTGAIRLEDAKRGAMWLQLGNKSMLMSQKLGQRLADECQSPEQVTYAQKIKANPLPSILDAAPAQSDTMTTPPPQPVQPAQPASAPKSPAT